MALPRKFMTNFIAENMSKKLDWRSLPNTLTLIRIAVIPILLLFFFLPGPIWRWLSVVIFSFACLTDFLDGYLARRKAMTSEWGGFLDPIADKLLVCSILLMMAMFDYFSPFTMIIALIILCREIFVSNLREFMIEADKINRPVSELSRWKTTVQMIALILLFIGDSLSPSVRITGEVFLWIAGVLTVITGYHYIRFSWQKMTHTLGK